MLFTRHVLSLALLAVAPAFGSSQTVNAEAQSAEFLRTVLNAPVLSAAARRAVAARERVDASGRLADVEVEGMGSRMVGPMDERATMWEVNVRQPLPKRGERAADRERAIANVSMVEAEYALMAGELAADTAMAIAEAQGAEARVRLLETQIGRLDAVLRSIESRIASGSGRIADRLTVQSRVAAMQLMIEEERIMAANALAEAHGRLGLRPDGALLGFAAPTTTDIRADEAAVIRAAAARGDEANAMAKMARASRNPMTAVGLRFEQERRAMGAQYRISAALTRVDRADRLAATARRLSSETLGRLNAEYDTMIRSAGAGVMAMGDSTILQTVEILEKATDTELQVIRADTAVRVARAELWRYMPVSQFPHLNN